MNPKFAAIDIGSNSSLLLILELGNDRVAKVVIDTKASTRLSSGTHDGAAMGEEALARQFAALDKFAEILNEQRVASVIACGTQVFRNARNGRDIAAEISRRYGWRMEIISGGREAELSFRAATTGLGNVGEKRTVIDVGGGSSEVIFGTGDRIDWSQSYPVGAVSITEKFGTDLVAARKYIVETLAELSDHDFQAQSTGERTEIFAVGGTAVTLAAIGLGQRIFDPRAIHGVRLTRTGIEETISKLGLMGSVQRRELMPFDPDRADIIVGGSLILSVILERLGATQAVVSNCGLRWGLIAAGFPQLEQARIEQ